MCKGHTAVLRVQCVSSRQTCLSAALIIYFSKFKLNSNLIQVITFLSDFCITLPDPSACNFGGSCSAMFLTISQPILANSLNICVSSFCTFFFWEICRWVSLSSFFSHFQPCQHVIRITVWVPVFSYHYTPGKAFFLCWKTSLEATATEITKKIDIDIWQLYLPKVLKYMYLEISANTPIQ